MVWKGTPEQKRAWAIKKRREAEEAARKCGSEALPGYETAPDQHRCNEHTIEGFSVPPSQIRCKECGRTWTYSPTKTGWMSVVVSPLTEKMPAEISVSDIGTKVAQMPPDHLQGAERGAWWRDLAA
jgi:hypothetical protein